MCAWVERALYNVSKNARNTAKKKKLEASADVGDNFSWKRLDSDARYEVMASPAPDRVNSKDLGTYERGML